MRHPTEGVLRRLIDEPEGVADAARTHVAACQQCLGTVATIQRDSEIVNDALAADRTDTDIDAAWSRLVAATPAAPTTAVTPLTPLAARRGRMRRAVRRPVVAGVAAAAILAGAGAAAASGWVQIFRTEQIAPISISTADLNAIPDLRAYGDVALTGIPNVHRVADAATAARESGLAVPEVADLPRGVSGEPTYQVGGEVSVTFTFSVERAARAAADAGKPLPPPPPGLDGSQVRLVAGPGVAAVWTQGGAPEMVVGRAIAPRAFSSSGVPFETMRDYLLSLPGLPANVAASLRTFNADGSTLPIPVPADRITTSSTTVDGERATVLTSRDRSVAAVAWVKDGALTVVGGPLDADEVVDVARSLR